jgi:hypothetical protein
MYIKGDSSPALPPQRCVVTNINRDSHPDLLFTISTADGACRATRPDKLFLPPRPMETPLSTGLAQRAANSAAAAGASGAAGELRVIPALRQKDVEESLALEAIRKEALEAAAKAEAKRAKKEAKESRLRAEQEGTLMGATVKLLAPISYLPSALDLLSKPEPPRPPRKAKAKKGEPKVDDADLYEAI